ncbi:MAG: T9SS type A sorting domain-containing protein, partial [Candidatus Kapabacteria bacterium]|nr:T9SS type A sorting domain-containing protein [Candidatus Kapabacteria bacterium]
VCIVQTVVPPLPVTLAAGDSITIELGYTPRAETSNVKDGWEYDTLVLTATGCDVRHAMRGMGVVPRVSVLDVLLDTVDVGGVICSTLGMAITNGIAGIPGTDTLVVTDARSLDEPFFVSDPPEPPLPLIIAPGESAYVGRICVRGEGNGPIHGDVVVVSNAIEGDSVSRISATVRGGVSVAEGIQASMLRFTPHPVQGALQVRWATPLAADAVVTLTNVSGRTVATAVPRSGDTGVEVDCSNLAPGAYVVRLVVAGSTVVHKPVIIVD